MAWSPQQEDAINDVKHWLKNPHDQVYYLAGYAGTGKTTLAKELANDVRGEVLYGAFTGKAALVLRRKGCGGASTIHSMIYAPQDEDENETWEPKFILNPDSPVKNAGLVVIDECSMVGEELGRDLLSFGTKVLVLGDPAQLPPVRGEGYFTSREPSFMLTEVHRQAADNPIIRMSMTIREGGRLEIGEYGESRVIPHGDIDAQQILAADQILVGLNNTRRAFNTRIRQLKGFNPAGPQTGDRLVCLKNNKQKKLLNGGLWDIQKILPRKKAGTFQMLVRSDDSIEKKPTDVRVRTEFFDGTDEYLTFADKKGTDEFTYGYALTCHKSQGSQWDNVVVFDEAGAFRNDANKWRYTAITRAAERVTVVQGRAA